MNLASLLLTLRKLDAQTVAVLARFLNAAFKSPDPQRFIREALMEYLDKPLPEPKPVKVKVTSRKVE